jgi:signal transduction histidine kinase
MNIKLNVKSLLWSITLNTLLISNSFCQSVQEVDSIRTIYLNGRQNQNPEHVSQGIDGCKSLITRFKKSGNRKKLILAYTLYGQILVDNNTKLAEAKDNLENALLLSREEFKPESDEVFEIKKYLSWACGYLKDLDKELQYSNEMLSVLKKNEKANTLKIADLYNTIGLNYGLRKQRDKEQQYLFDSKRMLENFSSAQPGEKMESQLLLANVLNSLSLSYIGDIDYQNALRYARMSLAISATISPESPERTPTMVVMARCYTLEKKCDSALHYINKALLLIEANGLQSTPMWLSYRSYKVNILSRCGLTDSANATARITIQRLLANGMLPDEALSQLMILSQHTNAELNKMEMDFNEKTALAEQKQTKERIIIGCVILFLIIAIVAGYIFYRYRQNKKEREFQQNLIDQRNEIRTRISYDIHDEIGSGLTQMSIVCFQGEMALKNQKPIEKPFLDKILAQINSLNESLTELTWTIKPGNDNIDSLITRMRMYVNGYSENSSLEVNLRLPEEDLEFSTNPEANRNLFFILKEGLNNIAKHSMAKRVEIDFQVDKQMNFRFEIADDGRGFDTSAPTLRTGKVSLESRAKAIKNGTFQLQSEIGKGTRLIVEGNLS